MKEKKYKKLKTIKTKSKIHKIKSSILIPSGWNAKTKKKHKIQNQKKRKKKKSTKCYILIPLG